MEHLFYQDGNMELYTNSLFLNQLDYHPAVRNTYARIKGEQFWQLNIKKMRILLDEMLLNLGNSVRG